MSKEWVSSEQALSGDLSKTREGIFGNVSFREADEEEEDYIRAQRIFAANSMQVIEADKHLEESLEQTNTKKNLLNSSGLTHYKIPSYP